MDELRLDIRYGRTSLGVALARQYLEAKERSQSKRPWWNWAMWILPMPIGLVALAIDWLKGE